MMPVVAGEASTRRQILVYSIILVAVTLLPIVVGMSGIAYALAATVLGAVFLHHAVRVARGTDMEGPRALFLFSILYLFLIFTGLVVDRAVALLV